MSEIFFQYIEYLVNFERGFELGLLRVARHTLIRLVHKRFPTLIIFAEQQAWDVNDREALHTAIYALLDASTEEQAGQVLAQITEK